jgi:hypothetical protein
VAVEGGAEADGAGAVVTLTRAVAAAAAVGNEAGAEEMLEHNRVLARTAPQPKTDPEPSNLTMRKPSQRPRRMRTRLGTRPRAKFASSAPTP